jgi:molybdopterin-containing oxidoreductase family iron-sulfur binding subunit
VALAQGRGLRDGEAVPACVQTCPTSALVFGNLYDEDSQVAKLLHHNARRYRLFDHLGTSPALYYLKGGASHVDAGD